MAAASGAAEAGGPGKDAQRTGQLMLLAVAAFYGSLNVMLRALYALPGPPSASALSVVRNLFIVLSFLPIFLSKSTPRLTGGFLLAALELSVWNLGAQGMLNAGLLFTDATRASFLTQTSVVLTPIVSLFAGEFVPKIVWAGCTLALAGVVILSSADGTAAAAAASAGGFGGGDLLVLGGALSWSMYIFRVGRIANRGFQAGALQAWKNVFLTGLYSLWLLVDVVRVGPGQAHTLWAGWQNWVAWALLILSAVIPGTMADYFQNKGQESVNASEANVILSSEPLWAAMLSAVFLSEVLSVKAWIGGSLIVLAALLSSGIFSKLKFKKA